MWNFDEEQLCALLEEARPKHFTEEQSRQWGSKAHVVPAVVQNECSPLESRGERVVADCCTEHNIVYVSHPPARMDPDLVSAISHPYVTRIGALLDMSPVQVLYLNWTLL